MLERMETVGTLQTRYSSEVHERAVRLVFEQQGEHASQWEAIGSIAGKIGCTIETLRKRVRRANAIAVSADEPPNGPETNAALRDCWSYREFNRCTADKPKPAQALLAYVSIYP